MEIRHDGEVGEAVRKVLWQLAIYRASLYANETADTDDDQLLDRPPGVEIDLELSDVVCACEEAGVDWGKAYDAAVAIRRQHEGLTP